MQVLTHTRPYKDLKDLSENHINEGARILPTELLPPDSTGYAHLEETWETGEEGARREGKERGGCCVARVPRALLDMPVWVRAVPVLDIFFEPEARNLWEELMMVPRFDTRPRPYIMNPKSKTLIASQVLSRATSGGSAAI